jgi:short-subunit dehydrogenase
MENQKRGHIINVSSVAGHKVGPGGVVYAATKHAVRAISEGLRQEVKPYNIRTTIISPGAVATNLLDTITDPVVAEKMHRLMRTHSRQLLRQHGRLRHEPAGGSGRERNPLPANRAGILRRGRPCL